MEGTDVKAGAEQSKCQIQGVAPKQIASGQHHTPSLGKKTGGMGGNLSEGNGTEALGQKEKIQENTVLTKCMSPCRGANKAGFKTGSCFQQEGGGGERKASKHFHQSKTNRFSQGKLNPADEKGGG